MGSGNSNELFMSIYKWYYILMVEKWYFVCFLIFIFLDFLLSKKSYINFEIYDGEYEREDIE